MSCWKSPQHSQPLNKMIVDTQQYIERLRSQAVVLAQESEECGNNALKTAAVVGVTALIGFLGDRATKAPNLSALERDRRLTTTHSQITMWEVNAP